jgi:hypothetical protein
MVQHSSIVAFLTGRLAAEEFEAEVAPDAQACEAWWKRSGVGHIIVTDGPRTPLGREHARRLLTALLDSRLSFLSANYAADCVIMSEDFVFVDEATKEAFAFVADDSRPPTANETGAALAALD